MLKNFLNKPFRFKLCILYFIKLNMKMNRQPNIKKTLFECFYCTVPIHNCPQ